MVNRLAKKFLLLAFLVLPVTLFGFFLVLSVDVNEMNQKWAREIQKQAIQKQSEQKCRDWHDWDFIKAEKLREGPGEQGKMVKLTDPDEIKLNDEWYQKTGFAKVISDKISVNRSIKDLRDEKCATFKYPRKLPKVSIIIIFVNEIRSVLLRTIHSVVNRTPAELLHEIILVNDNSTDPELYEPLQRYVSENFGDKVKIKNLVGRHGLIVTRLKGAKIATGEVLVFFDSHIEVGTNWLPPLLEPIARNRRLATVPIIDDFAAENFEVFSSSDNGFRGGIDWLLIYRHFERYLPNGTDILKPFPIPIMLGCAFAIDRIFFMEELGGYDDQYQIWNAENYELSYKLWMCADGLFEVPCSRVTHTFRIVNPSRNRQDDFVGRNFKRLAEVWMDEYRDVVYSYDPERYAQIDEGDLTKQIAIRERLNCKPFSFFMNKIAPDILERYPPTRNLPDFASGQIKSVKYPDRCVDIMRGGESSPMGIFKCHDLDDKNRPPQSQFFRLNFNKNLVFGYDEYCVDSYKISVPQCSYVPFGNQIWRYNYDNHLLYNGGHVTDGDYKDDEDYCLTGNFENKTLSVQPCDEKDDNQKWQFTFENKTAIDNYDSIFGYKKFTFGDKKIDYSYLLPLDYERCEE